MNSVDLEQALQEVEGTQVNDPAQVETGEAYEIYVRNGASDHSVTVPVYPINTIEQVYKYCLGEKSKDIGLDPHKPDKFFVNERLQRSTTNGNMTIEQFGLQPNDTLVIHQDGKVAAI